MILFKLLKLFGVDVPGHISQLRARFEQRVEVAKDRVRRAAQTAAIVAGLSGLAALAALCAASVGLFALYRWVFMNYGQFYGLAAVGGILTLAAMILFLGAFVEAKSGSGANHDGHELERVTPESQALANPTAAAVQATAFDEPPVVAQPSLLPEHAATSAADLVGPLSVILSRVMSFPTIGNPVLDELLVVLRGSAKGAADEAVDGVVRTVRYGSHTRLVSVLGAAVFVGWLLARHRPSHDVGSH
jgi:hypothetical protein